MTLAGLLAQRARESADEVPYTFLGRDGSESRVSYSELADSASRIAGLLGAHGLGGVRVVIANPSPRGYLESLFGCWYAGVIPVSGHLPEMMRSAKALEQVARTAHATSAAAVLTHRAAARAGEAASSDLRWLDAFSASSDRTDPEPPAGSPEEIAYVQSTSGSTGRQRGVELSNRNLLRNMDAQAELLPISSQTTMVSWLPVSHDMGFVAPVLQPLRCGSRTIFISPFQFLLDPFCWPQAISTYDATFSGGPNFGYELAMRRINFDQRSGLDLSTWTCAVNGAEPVRAETLDRFAKAFGPVGFEQRAFTTAYGLAEATSTVTCSRLGQPPVVSAFRRSELASGRAVSTDPGEANVRVLVGNGGSAGEHDVLVVDPVRLQSLPDGEVGEVWISGPSVAPGYVDAGSENQEVFGAELAGEDAGSYLRTGDLGFILDDELFITGRRKDAILIRGAVHAPEDIEETAKAAHPSLHGNGAAFGITVDGEEKLVLVIECDADREQLHSAIELLTGAVVETHGVTPHSTILAAPGSIPLTRSGKVQRRRLRDEYLNGGLDGALVEASTGERDQ